MGVISFIVLRVNKDGVPDIIGVTRHTIRNGTVRSEEQPQMTANDARQRWNKAVKMGYTPITEEKFRMCKTVNEFATMTPTNYALEA